MPKNKRSRRSRRTVGRRSQRRAQGSDHGTRQRNGMFSMPRGMSMGAPDEKRSSSVVGGFPDEQMVTLRYDEWISMAPGVGDAAYVFRGNDTFDPNFTGTGSQPAYRDNYAAVYYLQQVVASSITVKARQLDGTNSSSCMLVVAPCATTSGMTTFEQAVTLPGARTFQLNYYNPFAQASAAAASNAILGIQPVRGQGIGTAAVSASPTANSVWYWLIVARVIDQGTTTNLRLSVTIDYRTLFSGRVPAGLSLAHNEQVRAAFVKAQAAKKKDVFFVLPTEKPVEAKGIPFPEMKGEASDKKAESKGDTFAELTLDSVLDDKDELEKLRRWRAIAAFATSQVGSSSGVLPRAAGGGFSQGAGASKGPAA